MNYSTSSQKRYFKFHILNNTFSPLNCPWIFNNPDLCPFLTGLSFKAHVKCLLLQEAFQNRAWLVVDPPHTRWSERLTLSLLILFSSRCILYYNSLCLRPHLLPQNPPKIK